MPRPSLFVVLVLSTLGACTVADDEPAVDQSCGDPRYGDGVCQTELSCAVPDIDCFLTFEDDHAAAAWYGPIEAANAMKKGTAPRALLPTSDPRHALARSLLDRGWEAFRHTRPVGRLGEQHPGLVVIEEPEANAFVVRDAATQHAGFSVQVYTGLLDLALTDDARLALMMHELQHAVGLHVVEGTHDRIRVHYVAAGGEPIGRDQVDEPVTRAAITAWRDVSGEIGNYAQGELGGFPLGGDVSDVMATVLAAGIQRDPTKCARANTLISQLRREVLGSVDLLGGALTVSLTTLPPRVNAALVALKTECLAGFTASFVDVVAAMLKTTPADVMSHLSPADLALVSNKHVVDAINALTLDRRAKLRMYEAMLPGHAAWSTARYFSVEEDADDVASFVLDAAGLDPTAGAELYLTLLTNLDASAGARCRAELAAGTVPAYGVNLEDEHHDTCWRAAHVTQLATTPRTARRIAGPASGLPSDFVPPTRLPFPRAGGPVILY